MINNAARRWGHAYVMGRVNAYCAKCSTLSVTALTCRYDNEEDA
jgi:hypothetical protein